jgi:hypothetical protein
MSQTTMSNIDEIKADFISMYEIIKSLDKYKSAVDLQKRLKNKKIQKEKSKHLKFLLIKK